MLVIHWMWFLIAWDNWALLLLVRWALTWRHVRNPMHMNMHAHTCEQVRLTSIVHMHWVNFHSTHTIFSCLAEGRTNCQARTHCHWTTSVTRHTHNHNRSQWEDSPLRWWMGQITIISQWEVWRLYRCQQPLFGTLWVSWYQNQTSLTFRQLHQPVSISEIMLTLIYKAI